MTEEHRIEEELQRRCLEEDRRLADEIAHFRETSIQSNAQEARFRSLSVELKSLDGGRSQRVSIGTTNDVHDHPLTLELAQAFLQTKNPPAAVSEVRVILPASDDLDQYVDVLNFLRALPFSPPEVEHASGGVCSLFLVADPDGAQDNTFSIAQAFMQNPNVRRCRGVRVGTTVLPSQEQLDALIRRTTDPPKLMVCLLPLDLDAIDMFQAESLALTTLAPETGEGSSTQLCISVELAQHILTQVLSSQGQGLPPSLMLSATPSALPAALAALQENPEQRFETLAFNAMVEPTATLEAAGLCAAAYRCRNVKHLLFLQYAFVETGAHGSVGPPLESLTVFECAIGPDAIHLLAGRPARALTINASTGAVCDLAAKFMSRHRHALRLLNLEATSIDVRGMQLLCEQLIKPECTVRILRLRGTTPQGSACLSPDSFDVLIHELHQMRSLRELELNHAVPADPVGQSGRVLYAIRLSSLRRLTGLELNTDNDEMKAEFAYEIERRIEANVEAQENSDILFAVDDDSDIVFGVDDESPRGVAEFPFE
jgi:hypothetical protein